MGCELVTMQGRFEAGEGAVWIELEGSIDNEADASGVYMRYILAYLRRRVLMKGFRDCRR